MLKEHGIVQLTMGVSWQTLVHTLCCLADRSPVPPVYKCFPTLGMNVDKLSMGRANLTVWDLGGAADFRGVWEKYFREAHLVVFVVDAAAPSRLAEIRLELGTFSLPHVPQVAPSRV